MYISEMLMKLIERSKPIYLLLLLAYTFVTAIYFPMITSFTSYKLITVELINKHE